MNKVTMVKKLLTSGEPCRQCARAEEMLKARGLWERIDEVVVAIESDPESPGAVLARRHDISLAPFFIVQDGARERVYVSIGYEPCMRPLRPGEHERAARWWWEAETQRECGLHLGGAAPARAVG